MSLDFIHKDCHHSMSKDKKLPKDSFLVVYKVKDEIKHDITRAGSKVEIFDHYYDNYKNDPCVAELAKGADVEIINLCPKE